MCYFTLAYQEKLQIYILANLVKKVHSAYLQTAKNYKNHGKLPKAS